MRKRTHCASYRIGNDVVRSNSTIVNVSNPTPQTIEIQPTAALSLSVVRTAKLEALDTYSTNQDFVWRKQ